MLSGLQRCSCRKCKSVAEEVKKGIIGVLDNIKKVWFDSPFYSTCHQIILEVAIVVTVKLSEAYPSRLH